MLMFSDLINALKAQDLKPGESISLRQLCQASGLKPGIWVERLNFASTRFLVMEELGPEGYDVEVTYRSRRKQYHFLRL